MNLMVVIPLLAAILTAVGVSLNGYATWRRWQAENRAAATNEMVTLTRQAFDLVGVLNTEVARMVDEKAALHTSLDELQRRFDTETSRLRAQIAVLETRVLDLERENHELGGGYHAPN